MFLRSLLIARTALLLLVQRVTGPLRRRTRPERERLAGRAIARTLQRLGGLYTRLGHYLALRADLLPAPLRRELHAIRGDQAGRAVWQIQDQLFATLGHAASRFAWIDPVPLETSAVGQVNRARLLDGPQVTIKSCHPGVAPARVERRVRRMRGAARLFRRWIGRRQRRALLAGLGRIVRQELDLEREAQIAEAMAASFEDDPRVLVPGVHWEVSSTGVLTLDYVPRVRLDDRAQLERLGIDSLDCLALVCEAYGRQVLEHGLFHADPRPGEVFIVDEGDSQAPEGARPPRLLFMDFGLAQRLPDSLRADLRAGLEALIEGDVAAVVAALERLGALLQGRRKRTETAVREALAAGAAEALQNGAADPAPLAALVGQLLEDGAARAPGELLLYAKTVAHVLALAHSVAPEADPLPRLLPHLRKFLASSG
jgi:ubiquinone biosynthesis protein